MGATELQINSKRLERAYDEIMGFLAVHKYEMKQSVKPVKIVAKRPRKGGIFRSDPNIKVGFWNKPEEGATVVLIEWNRAGKGDALLIRDLLHSIGSKK